MEDYPGNRLSVILGGGRREFMSKGEHDHKGSQDDGEESVLKEGKRKDGRNIIHEWFDRKSELSQHEYQFVNSSESLRAVKLDKVKYLFGLFAHGHMEYEQVWCLK